MSRIRITKRSSDGDEHMVFEETNMVQISSEFPKISIGRGKRNKVVIQDDNLKFRHCRLERGRNNWYIKNLSDDSITLRDRLTVEKNRKKIIKNNDILRLKPESEVFLQVFIEPIKPNNQDSFANNLAQLIKCGICNQTLLDPVMIQNCGHNFCSSCLVVTFPQNQACTTCSTIITHTCPNLLLRQVVEDYLKYNPTISQPQAPLFLLAPQGQMNQIFGRQNNLGIQQMSYPPQISHLSQLLWGRISLTRISQPLNNQIQSENRVPEVIDLTGD